MGKGGAEMKYAMCPKCGRRLCKGENGTKVEME